MSANDINNVLTLCELCTKKRTPPLHGADRRPLGENPDLKSCLHALLAKGEGGNFNFFKLAHAVPPNWRCGDGAPTPKPTTQGREQTKARTHRERYSQRKKKVGQERPPGHSRRRPGRAESKRVPLAAPRGPWRGPFGPGRALRIRRRAPRTHGMRRTSHRPSQRTPQPPPQHTHQTTPQRTPAASLGLPTSVRPCRPQLCQARTPERPPQLHSTVRRPNHPGFPKRRWHR
jgi:hypothetical protein